jgi:serine phosphatase RsbU (regulator of sigma subunit)
MSTEKRKPRTTPMLRVASGPAHGRLYPLDGETVVIGRINGCEIVLPPRHISKRHAAIERRSDGYYLKDLGSMAGTFVGNRKLVEPVRLEDGASFRVCEFVFVFHEDLDIIDDRDDTSTIVASRDASAAGSDRPGVAPEPTLRALLTIVRDLGRALRLDEVLDRTLDGLFKVFPQAERGAVLLVGEADGDLKPRAIRSRRGPLAVSVISRTIADLVLDRHEAILCRDAAAEFTTSESVHRQGLRSLICAPLLDSDRRPLGLIQLDAGTGRGEFSREDLDLLIAVSSPIGLAVANARLHRWAIREAEFEQELACARAVQMAMLPEPRSDLAGYPLWTHYEPARQVGGDYYGYFPLPRPGDPPDAPCRRWAVAVGDVTGKGIPAALFVARLFAEVRVALQVEADPVRVVARLNRHLCAARPEDLFVTFLLTLIDSEAHTLTVVRAGHMGPIVRRRRDRWTEVIGEDAGGLPLGVDPGETYGAAATTLEPGDVVVLSTDGVETLSPSGELLTLPALSQVIREAPGLARSVGEAIIQAVRSHQGDRPAFDDLTLLCLERPEIPNPPL